MRLCCVGERSRRCSSKPPPASNTVPLTVVCAFTRASRFVRPPQPSLASFVVSLDIIVATAAATPAATIATAAATVTDGDVELAVCPSSVHGADKICAFGSVFYGLIMPVRTRHSSFWHVVFLSDKVILEVMNYTLAFSGQVDNFFLAPHHAIANYSCVIVYKARHIDGRPMEPVTHNQRIPTTYPKLTKTNVVRL